MIQTNWVVERLRQQWPNLEIAIEQIRTTGDQITHVPLTQIGGDGVFVTEIERALQERRIDLAVHSLKDLPTAQPDGLQVVVAGPREDVRDIFVSNQAFRIDNGRLQPVETDVEWSQSPRIGTSSLRRSAQIREFYPGAQLLTIRGNVDTRLRKLESGAYDGIVVAAAGLHRMELQPQLAERLTYFPIEMMMPAPGQGALGLEIRNEPEMQALLEPLRDVMVQAATSAERMFMRRLGAGCYLPIAAYAEVIEDDLVLRGLVISTDGQRSIRVRQSVRWSAENGIARAEMLGIRLAEQALDQGAQEIIQGSNMLREREQQRV
jgi:hydroxymethylbilane synthase